MGFELTLTVNVRDNPDAIGEALRSMFFSQEMAMAELNSDSVISLNSTTLSKTGVWM